MKFEWYWQPVLWSWGFGACRGWTERGLIEYTYRSLHLGPLSINYKYKEWST